MSRSWWRHKAGGFGPSLFREFFGLGKIPRLFFIWGLHKFNFGLYFSHDHVIGNNDSEEIMTTVFDSLTEDLDAIYAPSRKPAAPVYKQTCGKCNGKGRVTFGFTYVQSGTCFACKGKGFFEFKTSPEQRAKARVASQARKDRVQAAAVARADDWRAANPVEAQWLEKAASRGFEFAVSLSEALNKFGHLTEGQIAAVRKCIVRDNERKVEQAQRAASAPELTVEAIETAFANAKQAGIKWPKLRLDDFVFSPAGANSANAGAVYVKQGETYLGKVLGGKLFASRDCNNETRDRIVAVATDPHAAAVAYGKRFGRCAVCARELSDEASIERGIGPVCAENYGW